MPAQLRKTEILKGNNDSYEILSFIDHGRFGEVYEASSRRTGETVAIKLFRPADLYGPLVLTRPDSTSEPAASTGTDHFLQLHQSELKRLHGISHDHVVGVLDYGIFEGTKSAKSSKARGGGSKPQPFLVTEYINGGRMKEYLAEPGPQGTPRFDDVDLVFELCAEVADALAYLHDFKQFLHYDVNVSNILIDQSRGTPRAVLIDFGSCKNLDLTAAEANEVTIVFGSEEMLLPPELRRAGHPLYELYHRAKGVAAREDIRRLFFPWVDVYQFGRVLLEILHEVRNAAHWTKQDHRYLRHIAERAQRSHLAPFEVTAAALARALRRGMPQVRLYHGVRSLTPYEEDDGWSPQLPDCRAHLSQRAHRIAWHPAVRRLAAFRQLALVDLIYPGATASRYIHCLKAYERASALAGALMRVPEFSYHFTPSWVESFQICALLHDINHFPLMHVFQELKTPKLKRLDLLQLICERVWAPAQQPLRALIDDTRIGYELFKRLLKSDYETLAVDPNAPQLAFIKSAIDSGADVDKLAYVPYDALFTGVGYGRQLDTERLVAAATAVPFENGLHLAYTRRAIPALEQLVTARYSLFRTVYWHRDHRALMAMLQFVMGGLLRGSSYELSDFIRETFGRDEWFSIRLIDKEYRERIDKHSTIGDVLLDPAAQYQRVFTIAKTRTDEGRSLELLRRLAKISADDDAFEKYQVCAFQLLDALLVRHGFWAAGELRREEILIDFPRRKLDQSGKILIEIAPGEPPVPLQTLSDHVAGLGDDFTREAARLRVFLHPRRAAHVSDEDRRKLRPHAIEALHQAAENLAESGPLV